MALERAAGEAGGVRVSEGAKECAWWLFNLPWIVLALALLLVLLTVMKIVGAEME